MDLIDTLRIYLPTYIVHNKIFADPQSNKDWCYKGRCPTISVSRSKTAGMIIFEKMVWNQKTKNIFKDYTSSYSVNHRKVKKNLFTILFK